MKNTDELIKTALVGTERLEPSIKQAIDIPDISNYLETIDKEEKLLTLSGLVFKYNMAGKTAEKLDNIEFTSSEKESLEILETKFSEIINNLFHQYSQLLTEFLEQVVKAEKLFPPIFLPQLLDSGIKDKTLQEYIIKVAGKRGIWLAKQNKKWNYIFDQDINEVEIWEAETTASRVNLLKNLRHKEPEKVIKLMESTWKEESAQDKIKFMETLEINLSKTDEAFLESCLDDKRSKEVKRRASELLAIISDSELTKRMTERFDKLFQITETNSKITVNIEVIEKPDKSLLRDTGGDECDLKSYQAQQAFVYNLIMTTIPLKFFTDKFQKTPDEIIKIVIEDKSVGALNLTTLLQHLSNQTIKEKNEKWAKAFINYSDYESLFIALSPKDQEKFILKKLKQSVEKYSNLLYSYNQPWSENFSLEVIEIILKSYKDKKNYFHPVQALVNKANIINPDLFLTIRNRFLPVINPASSEFRRFLEFLEILEFRYQMREEFK